MKHYTNKKIIVIIFSLLFASYSYCCYADDRALIQELNATETDVSNLIEGVNQFTNETYIQTRALLQQKYQEMNPNNPEPKTLYYPASGADICYPFLLFPTLDTVYAFALEEFGEVADINKDRVGGRLPSQWRIASTLTSDPIHHGQFLAVTHDCGWDELSYYSQVRGNRVCADLLFKIRHILRGTILEVHTINEFCHEIRFEYLGIPRRFVYLQYKEENCSNFRDILLQLLPHKLDILFNKGINKYNQPGSYKFSSLCVVPFLRIEDTSYNPMAVMEPSLPAEIQQAKIARTISINHPDFQTVLFSNLRNVVAIDTDLAGKPRFAFGYSDLMYIGPVKQLRPVI